MAHLTRLIAVLCVVVLLSSGLVADAVINCGWFQSGSQTYWGGVHRENAGACVAETTCKFCPDDDTYPTVGECMGSGDVCAQTAIQYAIPVDDKLMYTWIKTEVYPNKMSYFSFRPKNRYNVARIIARTMTDEGGVLTHLDTTGLGDNLDLYVKRSSTASVTSTVDLPIFPSNYDYTSVRESNPWVIDLSQSVVSDMCSGAHSTTCKPFLIGVMGDNQFPQKSGASQFELKVWWELDFPDFDCVTTGPGWDAACKTDLVRYDQVADSNVPMFVIPNSGDNTVVFQETGKIVSLTGTTPIATDSAGGLFFSEKLYLKDGFETNFAFKITEPSICGGMDGFCGGGDGLAFVIFNPDDAEDTLTLSGNWLTALGQEIGYSNIPRSLALEFDTWHNPDYYDPKQGVEHWWINATEYVSYADNHIALFSYGGGPNTADHSADGLIAATPSIPNLSDGLLHRVKIWYMPRAGSFPGSMSVFIDNMDRPVLVTDVTLETQKLDSSAAATCRDTFAWVTWFDVYYTDTIGGSVVETFTVEEDTTAALRISPTTFNFTSATYTTPQRIRIGYNRESSSQPAVNTPITVTVTKTSGTSSSQTVQVYVHDASDANARVIINTARPKIVISCNEEISEEIEISLTKSPLTGETVRITPISAGSLTFTPSHVDFTSSNYNWVQKIKVSQNDVGCVSSGTLGTTTITFALSEEGTVPGGAIYNPLVCNPCNAYTAAVAGPILGHSTINVEILKLGWIYVTHTNGATALRAGGTDTVNVRLIEDPGTINFGLAGSDFTSSSLSVTSANWDTVQTVTLTDDGGTTDSTIGSIDSCGGGGTCPLYVMALDVLKLVPANKFRVVKPYDFDIEASALHVLSYGTNRCVLDHDGRAYIGFTTATGTAAQKVTLSSWSFCHKLGCVAY